MILTSLINPGHNPETPALHYLADDKTGKWDSISNRELWTSVIHTAAGLHALNLGVQHCLGILSENRPEVIMTYFAAFRLRAVPVSIYSTSSTEQVRFITADAKISHIVVGSQKHYDMARAAGIRQIIAIDPFRLRRQFFNHIPPACGNRQSGIRDRPLRNRETM